MPVIEAMYYEPGSGDEVNCGLCPQRCRIKAGSAGRCGVRQNRAGKLVTINYGEISSLALDPIEKKPLYHFYPGSMILSAGTFGCNLFCSFCQNYSIARGRPLTQALTPAGLVQIALAAVKEGSVGVAFTYNEPSIWYEYILPACRLLKENGLKSVLVTNGYIGREPLEHLLPFVDAMNIDVKAFTSGFYRRNCQADLDSVKATVERAAGKVHLEITNLVIPKENDDLGEIRSLARWLAGLSPLIPLHLSRYFPAYKMTAPPTPAATLKEAVAAAGEYLHFVYAGNLGGIADDTICPQCGQVLIKRQDYDTEVCGIEAGRCRHCGAVTDYINL